jgi:UDP-N-acetylglucosamine 4,6-dehydratase
MSRLKGKTVFITGGTGSWGHELTRQILKNDPAEIRIFSRGEHAQVEMAREFDDLRLNFYIGDVRDEERLMETMRGVDVVFHLAALKHVPICERHIWEAVQTNVYGTNAVIRAALFNDVDVAVYVSSDKAVEPINIYGQTKAIAEKLFVAANSMPGKTRFACLRSGNVIGTHGSVIPLFNSQIANSGKVTLTDKRMTRFFELQETVIELLLRVAEEAHGGEIFIPKMQSVNIETLAKVMIEKLSGGTAKIEYIGMRPGEKIHELLISESEIGRVAEFPNNFVILPYDFLSKREKFSDYMGKMAKLTGAYGSGTIPLLTPKEIENVLRKGGYLT